MNVPFRNVAVQYEQHRGEIDDAVRAVLASGHYIQGPEVCGFESAFAQYLSIAHVIGVNSGTDALVLALRALDIGPGDEVVVPSYTFVATAHAVCLAGATPRFADCGDASFNVDAAGIAAACTDKTRAVIPVHLFGEPLAISPIVEFCREHRLALIEDVAQATGARSGGHAAGTFGIVGAFSFYPTKNLGACGDAGAIVCRDDELAMRLRRLSNHGLDARCHDEPGLNSRLDAVQAAILRVKLPRLDEWNARRRVIAHTYAERLADTECVLPAVGGEDPLHVFHHFVILHPRRDELRAWLSERGIGTAVYYERPCHLMPLFRNRAISLPRAERCAAQALALPIYPEMNDADIDCVTEQVRMFGRRASIGGLRA